MNRYGVVAGLTLLLLGICAGRGPGQFDPDDEKWNAVKRSMRIQGILDGFPRDAGEAEAERLLEQVKEMERAGKLKEAIGFAEKLVKKVKETYGATSVEAVARLNDLGVLYIRVQEYNKAEKVLAEATEILRKHPGEVLARANVAANLAGLNKILGEYETAEKLFLQALKFREAKLKNQDPQGLIPMTLNNIGDLYLAMGRYDAAEAFFDRVMKLHQRKPKDHIDRSAPLNNLALVHQARGRYDKAEPLLQRSLEIRQAHYGDDDHPAVVALRNNLASVYQATGRFEKAEELYHSAIKSLERANHSALPIVLNNLAGLYSATRRYKESEKIYRRSLELREATLDKNHQDVALALNNLAELFRKVGRYDEGEPLLRRALAIREAGLPADHPDIAFVLNNLGGLYAFQGKPAEAEKHLLRAGKMLARLGEAHPRVVDNTNNLARLVAQSSDLTKAGQYFDRARRGARRHLLTILPGLTEQDRIGFFQNTSVRTDWEDALSLGLWGSNANLAELSASWLLNGKSVDQESLTVNLLLARQSDDSEVGKLTAELVGVRSLLARAALAPPLPGREKERTARLETLSNKEQELAKTLRKAGNFAAPPGWVELAEVRKSLPVDSVFIDFAHIHPFDPKAKPNAPRQAARYVAWVTPVKGDVKVIDLGPADKVDEAVKAFREAIAKDSKGINDEEKAEKALHVHLAALSKLILDPLLPHIGKSKRWLISPDGNLWLLPFETLTLDSKSPTYAIEKYQISYLTSGRDLIPSPAPKITGKAPIIFANPDFDLDPKRARQVEEKLGVKGDAFNLRSEAGVSRLGKAKALKGTASEAKDATPLLKLYTNLAPEVRTQEEALEGVFKSLVKNPKVVLFATHGFFLPDREKSKDDKGKPVWENPLLRSGLLLAGCNKSAEEGDDGFLTALEVVGTDLRGCEQVVLSACETGLGEVQSGEGVSGLRQAFQLAGAKTVVSTLWQVHDKASARLMKDYFENLSMKMSKADALCEAKRTEIEYRRSISKVAHPFFWAAFTLTGE